MQDSPVGMTQRIDGKCYYTPAPDGYDERYRCMIMNGLFTIVQEGMPGHYYKDRQWHRLDTRTK